jgi:hypothetical protein
MASKDSEARLRAEEKFAKAQRRETDIMNGQRQLWQAEADKLVRLRALRLAKEAAEKQVAENAAAETSANGATAGARQGRRPKARAASRG